MSRTIKSLPTACLFLLMLGVGSGVLLPASYADPSNSVADLRRSLRQAGFKLNLSEFDFTFPGEVQDRSASLCTDGKVSQRPVSFLEPYDLLTPTGEHAAVVVWSQKELAYPSGFMGYSYLYAPGTGTNVWPALREVIADAAPQLDVAAAAALSGPIGFNLDATAGPHMLLPHLPGLKYYTQILGGRAILALHDGDTDAAWTNWLAATRIVTAWRTEPAEVSEYVRFDLLLNVYNLTWQALQAGIGSDSRLARLQQEWEGLDLFQAIPDVFAFRRAGEVVDCRREQGSDAAERDLLLFYRDREVEARQAIRSRSWAEMRHRPGVTNAPNLEVSSTNLPNGLSFRLSSRRLSLRFLDRGIGLFGRAADAEARRRLLIIAIALERFHVRHGSYPASLDALAPDVLKATPVDFMNGQPLHYSRSGDGHFLLYSVGFDCEDNGGKMALNSDERRETWRPQSPDPDIVWPLPASPAIATAYAAKVLKRVEDQFAAEREREVQQAAEAEAARQATVKELLSNPKYQKTTWTGDSSKGPEPIYHGQPLSKFLRPGTNALSLDALLTLKQVITGDEPEIVTYRLPISYDVLASLRGDKVTNAFQIGQLKLLMDCDPDRTFMNEPELADCERATNGDCLLVWNTAFERPGQHALQALFLAQGGPDTALRIKGPVTPYSSTNLCQFQAQSSMFDDHSAYLFARLAESNASYSIEIKTRAGKHFKTLTGSSTNGLIDLEWDLTDDKGNAYTNNSFESFFHVSLPGSGRSQTLKQIQNKIGTSGD